MKRKIIAAVLLTVCCGCLAILSGAVPVSAGAAEESLSPAGDPVAGDPAPGRIAGEPSGESTDDPPEETGGSPAPAEAPDQAPDENVPAEETAQTPPEKTAAAPAEAPAEETTETPAEEAAEEPAEEPAEEAAPEEAADGLDGAEPPAPTVSALTITGELLDNDTYYNIDPDELLAEGVSLRLPAEGYQVLILHTHATEAYDPYAGDGYERTEDDDYRTTDPDHSVIRVGAELAAALEEQGLHVLHDTGLYDYPSYNGSYARSGEAIEEYLAAYPGIGIVIDLHRDAIGEGDTIYKTSADIDGVECAQLMLVMGTDVNLEHPAWRENLAAALALQTAVAQRYPCLMRPMNLCDFRYNQQLAPGGMLLEVGAAGNTLEEALEAVRRFAEAAGPVMASWIEE